MVGAVVVKNGEVISTGYHGYAGGPHAEHIALQKAGEKAKDATLYANLEPCCHQGKTPPCVEIIRDAGITKVVVAMLDPNPLVNGKGIKWLREKGIKVKVGVLEDKARHLNEVFIKYITTRRPFVIVKAAMSFDGKIATREGDSRWITGKKSRQMAHRLRSRADAIIVGINTVIKDNPVLTTRLTDKEDVYKRQFLLLAMLFGGYYLVKNLLAVPDVEVPEVEGLVLELSLIHICPHSRQAGLRLAWAE